MDQVGSVRTLSERVFVDVDPIRLSRNAADGHNFSCKAPYAIAVDLPALGRRRFHKKTAATMATQISTVKSANGNRL